MNQDSIVPTVTIPASSKAPVIASISPEALAKATWPGVAMRIAHDLPHWAAMVMVSILCLRGQIDGLHALLGFFSILGFKSWPRPAAQIGSLAAVVFAFALAFGSGCAPPGSSGIGGIPTPKDICVDFARAPDGGLKRLDAGMLIDRAPTPMFDGGPVRD